MLFGLTLIEWIEFTLVFIGYILVLIYLRLGDILRKK